MQWAHLGGTPEIWLGMAQARTPAHTYAGWPALCHDGSFRHRPQERWPRFMERKKLEGQLPKGAESFVVYADE